MYAFPILGVLSAILLTRKRREFFTFATPESTSASGNPFESPLPTTSFTNTSVPFFSNASNNPAPAPVGTAPAPAAPAPVETAPTTAPAPVETAPTPTARDVPNDLTINGIKSPWAWTPEDYQRVKDTNPELVNVLKSLESQESRNLSAEEVESRVQFMIGMTLQGIWAQLFRTATSRLTTGDINAYMDNTFSRESQSPTPQELEIINRFKTLAKTYFNAEEGPVRNYTGPSASTGVAPPIQTTPQGMDVTTIASLEAEYGRLRDQYQTKVDEALQSRTAAELNPLMDEITELSSQISATLDKLISKLAAEEAKGNANFATKRTELTERLAQIKKDYAGLVSATDRMTTLKRIRDFEEKKANSGLKYYLIFFGVAVSLLIVIIFRKMFQSSPNPLATNPIASTPTISPALST